jgi:hypothetical protein
VVECLSVLCQIHGVDKPEIPDWRHFLQAQHERFEQLSRSFSEDLERGEEAPPLPDTRAYVLPKQRCVRKPKKVSKQELKRRSTQRKANRKKR